MRIIELLLLRDVFSDTFTLGQLTIDGKTHGYTCEDKDRYIESGGEKLAGQTAIPRGRYRLSVSMSNRFKRIMPIVIGVPQFSGVRIHGGNTHEDTEGCPLLGAVRTESGVRDCKVINEDLIRFIMSEEKIGNMLYLTVR